MYIIIAGNDIQVFAVMHNFSRLDAEKAEYMLCHYVYSVESFAQAIKRNIKVFHDNDEMPMCNWAVY